MFALPLALVGCNKKEAPRAEYLFDINMTQAERVTEIAEEGITLEENRFMVVFTDDKESCMLTLLIQGEEGETTLSAGTYNRALELDECIFVTENGSQYTFSEGIVNVALENKIYTIDALFSDAKGKKYHFTYEGLIANMAEEKEVTEYFVDSKMKSADRLIPAEFYDISDGDMGITLTDGLYTLAMVFTLEDGKDVLTAGRYSTELGNLKVDEGFYINITGTVRHFFEKGEATVEGDIDGYKFEFFLYDAEGRTFHITYEGVVSWMTTKFEDSEFEGRCYGHYEGCENYNYVLCFGRNIGDEYDNAPSKQRFVVDIYNHAVEKDANGYFKVPNGTYTFDNTNSMAIGTISAEYSYIEFGNKDAIFSDATLVVTDEGATLTAKVARMAEVGGDVEYSFTYKGEVLAIQTKDFVAEL